MLKTAIILLNCLSFATLCQSNHVPKYKSFQQLDYVNATAPTSQEIRLSAIGYQFDQTNPFSNHGRLVPGVLDLVYETLIKAPADDTACFYPLLVTPHLTKDKVLISLSQNVTFSNGDHLSLNDIIYSIQQAKHSLNWKDIAKPIKRIERNRDKIIVHYQGHADEVIAALGKIPILQKDSHLGSGPYTLQILQKEYAKFSKRENYWGEGHWLNIGRNQYLNVSYKFLPYPQLSWNALRAQEIDLFLENNASRWHHANSHSPLRKTILHQKNSTYTQYLRFHKRFSNPHLRQAIAALLDFNQMNEILCYGQYIPSSSNQTLSIQKALAMLDEAGWVLKEDHQRYCNNEICTLNLTVNTQWLNTAVIIQHILKKYGIKLNILSLPHSAYIHAIRGEKYDLLIAPIVHKPYMKPYEVIPPYAQHLSSNQEIDRIQDMPKKVTQLIAHHHIIPMWSSNDFRIHHHEDIILHHLDGLDKIDIMASWKNK